MSLIREAFKIPRNKENKDFVNNPYIPFQSLTYSIPPNNRNYVNLTPLPLTIARCFDIKYGSENGFTP